MGLEPRTQALVLRGRFMSSVVIVTMAGLSEVHWGSHQPDLQIRKPAQRGTDVNPQSHSGFEAGLGVVPWSVSSMAGGQ